MQLGAMLQMAAARFPGSTLFGLDLTEKVLSAADERIEESFRDMKTTLRYEFNRGLTPRMVKLEMEILLLAYNLMRYVMARGGKGAAGTRFGIASTSAAVKSFLSVVQSVYRAGRSCARAFSRLVRAVASDVLPKRRRKAYVRAVKRRPKPYPLLMKPRGEFAPEEVL